MRDDYELDRRAKSLKLGLFEFPSICGRRMPVGRAKLARYYSTYYDAAFEREYACFEPKRKAA